MANTQLIIVGAGALSREIICWIESARKLGLAADIKGYLVDPQYPRLPDHYQLPWLGSLADYSPQPDEQCVVSISDSQVKRAVVTQLRALGARFAAFIHPSAVLAHTAQLGEGCIVCPHAMVSADAIVGDFVTINAHTSIGHDSRIGAFANLSAHVDVTGYVEVGEAAFFGSGARVLPKLKVGANAKVGAGSVVMRSVPADTTVYTTPAKRL
jgi:sugar O-acyltransferase (sialic acid O-acetyltransferase NeuD family)